MCVASCLSHYIVELISIERAFPVYCRTDQTQLETNHSFSKVGETNQESK